MGAYLSQPSTTKTSSDGGNSNMSYGFSAMQGWRVSMEVRRKMNKRIRDSGVAAVFAKWNEAKNILLGYKWELQEISVLFVCLRGAQNL